MNEHSEGVINKQPESVQFGRNNLPDGLTELAKLDTIHVRQRLDVVEGNIYQWQCYVKRYVKKPY